MPQPARIRTVLVGSVETLGEGERAVESGIVKRPVAGPIRAAGVKLAGDAQADLTVHGGPHKAVYAFPAEHYAGWRAAFPGIAFDDGAFGENLTTEGLDEESVHVGDRFRCGTVELTVTQPRMPCFKLGLKLGDPKVIKHMLASGQTGFYFAITREGELQAGDAMERLERLDGSIPVARVTDLYAKRATTPAEFRAVAGAPGMIESWRSWALERAAKLEG